MKWGTQQGSGLWGTVPTTCSAHGQKAISGLFQQVPSSETGHGEAKPQNTLRMEGLGPGYDGQWPWEWS